MAELTLKHIYKVYGGNVRAVNDFCMTAKDGDFVVLVGPSGCGKSTTLRMIAGLEEVTSGTIVLDDMIMNYEEPKNRPIAMVFQNYALYPHLTVYENLAFGLKTGRYTREETDRRVRAAAESLGLTLFLDRKPNALSGGQMQRVALGRALVKNAKIVLLDEPLSNLDAKLRAKMRVELTGLHHLMRNIFIYVTHDQVEAMTMATKIIVMNNSFVQQVGTPMEVYNDPVNKFVAAFIGSPTMKFIPARVEREGDEVTVHVRGSSARLPLYEVAAMGDRYFGKEDAVEIGIRSKNVRIVERGAPVYPNEIVIEGKVSVIEKLGSEKLVHADMQIDAEVRSIEGESDLVASVRMDKRVEVGDVCLFAVDCRHVNFFDRESQRNIAPDMPEEKTVRARVAAGKLRVFGTEIALPPALSEQIGAFEGEVFLTVPVAAVKEDAEGAFAATVRSACEREGERVCAVRAGESYVFFRSDLPVGSSLTFSLDLKAVTVSDAEGNTLVSPLPAASTLSGVFIREKGKDSDDYRNVIEGYRMPFDFGLSAELIKSMGKEIFKTELGYSFSPYAVSVGKEGIPATFERLFDYGAERIAEFSVNGKKALAAVGDETYRKDGEYHILPDLGRLKISDLKKGIDLI